MLSFCRKCHFSSSFAGMEAAGEVVAVGPGLTGRKVGDIVAYAGDPMGVRINA